MMTIRDIRVSKGMTQEELCKKAKISRSRLCKIENSCPVDIRTSTAERLANALGVSESKIFSIIRPQK